MQKLYVFAAALLLASCRTTKIIPVERVRTDTVYKVREHRDSIRLHDSITVTQYLSGDTVYHIRDRWHAQYVERLRTDTVYQSITDSVPVPYPIEKQVPRSLSKWQKIFIATGKATCSLIAAFLIAAVFCLFRKR